MEYFAYFYVVSMTARSSEVDDERDEWEGMGPRARERRTTSIAGARDGRGRVGVRAYHSVYTLIRV